MGSGDRGLLRNWDWASMGVGVDVSTTKVFCKEVSTFVSSSTRETRGRPFLRCWTDVFQVHHTLGELSNLLIRWDQSILNKCKLLVNGLLIIRTYIEGGGTVLWMVERGTDSRG